jgi:iodotyrosine deiodinase
MDAPRFEPRRFTRLEPDAMLERARAFHLELDRRRTTRQFSTDPVPRELVELAIRAASTAPSGAHRQPRHFTAVADPAIKAAMRAAAEREEHQNYAARMSPEWIAALAPLGTDEHKAHITEAPWVVVAFKKPFDVAADGARSKNYYVDESVGIACGLLIAAVHHMGLVTLTHTPSPMGFLAKLLGRPENERAYLLMPVGYPSADAVVPALKRKSLEDVATFL